MCIPAMALGVGYISSTCVIECLAMLHHAHTTMDKFLDTCVSDILYHTAFVGLTPAKSRPYARTKCIIPRSRLRTEFRFLEWVSGLVVFPEPYLLLLLGRHMLHPDLLRLVLHKCSDVSRVPELTGNTKIFAAPHQGIGFAAFGGGGNAFGGEIVLFASCN